MQVSCPICGSYNVIKDYTISVDQIVEETFPESEIKKRIELKKAIVDLWNSRESSFFSCNNCKYGFANPYISGDSKYYSILYYTDFSYPKEKWEYIRTSKSIKDIQDNSKIRLLEIGAGNGSFLDIASYMGIPKDNIYSTEYSLSACETIQSKGYRSSNDSFDGIIKKNEWPKFDIICMFQVLEHLDNIKEVFTFLDQFSDKGTRLYIAVPNSILRNMLDKSNIHYDLPPTHVGKFSLETFQYISTKFGWEIIEFDYESATKLKRIKKFLFERYWKNKWAIFFEKGKRKLLKYIFRYSILVIIFIRYLNIFYKLRHNKYGTSFWIHLKK